MKEEAVLDQIKGIHRREAVRKTATGGRSVLDYVMDKGYATEETAAAGTVTTFDPKQEQTPAQFQARLSLLIGQAMLDGEWQPVKDFLSSSIVSGAQLDKPVLLAAVDKRAKQDRLDRLAAAARGRISGPELMGFDH